MIAARIARQAPAERRDFIGRLLLDGMPWTDVNPWFGAVGLAAMIVLMGVLEQAP